MFQTGMRLAIVGFLATTAITSANAARKGGAAPAGHPAAAAPRGAAPAARITAPRFSAPGRSGSPRVGAFSFSRGGVPGISAFTRFGSGRRVFGTPNSAGIAARFASPSVTGSVANPQLRGNFASRIQGAGPSAQAFIRDPNHAGSRAALRNQALSDPRLQRSLGDPTFRGRFGWGGRRWSGGGVLGWYGPLFWPYAYYDLFDYVYWPYAYDTFWPYAYDDLYAGLFGPYAYAYDSFGSSHYSYRYASVPAQSASVAQICTEQAPGLTDLPLERMAQAVQRDEAQGGALEDLKKAVIQAVEILRAGCPTDLPSTPTGRIEATEKRLEVMLQAVQVVRPAMDKFYQTLSDEQKANLNMPSAQGDQTEQRQAGRGQSELTQMCSGQAPGLSSLPIDRIEQAIQPTLEQRAQLDKLKDASVQAGNTLKSSCPSSTAVTPPGRIEAMEKRLDAILTAVKIMRPQLGGFYSSLSDEQKARFNMLGARD